MTKQFTLEEINALIEEERANPIHKPFQLIDPKSHLAKLYRMQGEVMKRQREAYEDKHYTKQIDCPEHPGKHQAILFQHPHRCSGMWECPTGISDAHEHENYEIEEIEHMSPNPDSSYYWTERIYVCADCGEMIEDANPDEDRAEAIADAQIMEALGK